MSKNDLLQTALVTLLSTLGLLLLIRLIIARVTIRSENTFVVDPDLG